MLCCVRAPPDDVTEVDVSSVGLRHLPDSVWLSGRTLEVLRADNNHIQELPRALFTCTHLRVLTLNDNGVTSLPAAVRALAHLEHLDLGRNALSDLPGELRALRRLRVLHLSGNPLERPPETLTTLVFLQELFLNDACLEFLPANFGRLTDLRILEVRDNCLVLLPKSLARCADLRRLDIGQNEFSDFPEVIGKLTKLRELWMDCNNLSTILPVIENLTELTHLEAGDNQISDLPPEIAACVQLVDVNLSSNRLNELPNTIGNLVNLVSLKLDCNKLFELPDGIGGLVNLEELTLASNFLCEIPSAIGRLRKLQYLIIDENVLKALPLEIGGCSSLTVLSLRANRLTFIPNEVGRLSELRVLNLVRNSLRCLPHSLLNCANLVALWLAENQSKPLVPMQSEIDPMTNARVLTCFLFPQVPLSDDTKTRENESFPSDIPISVRHISFVDVKAAAKNGLEKPGQLRRAPTPYPKELRALAKHARGINRDSTDESTPSMQNAIHIKAAKVTPTLRQKFASNHTISSAATTVTGDWYDRNSIRNRTRNGSIYDNSPLENPYDKPLNYEQHKSYQNVDQTLYSESTDSAYSGYNEQTNRDNPYGISGIRENYSAVEERVNNIIERSSQDLYAAAKISDKRISPLVLPFDNLSTGTRNSVTGNTSLKNQELSVNDYPVTDHVIMPIRDLRISEQHHNINSGQPTTYSQLSDGSYVRQMPDAYDHYSHYPSNECSARSEDKNLMMQGRISDQMLNNSSMNRVSPNSYNADPNAIFNMHQQTAYYSHQNGNNDNLYDSTSVSSHHSSYVQNSNLTPGYSMYDPHESVLNANIRNNELRPPLQSAPSVSPSKMNPPPYHIAATYSKQAQFFNSNN